MNVRDVDPRLGQAARNFLAGKHQALIGGKWVDAKSGKTFETYDPRTGKVIAQVAECDAADVDAAVAAAHLKKGSLELGGKSPVIVFPDADLSLAVPGAARAIFNNSGQVCAAGSRLYAHAKVFDRMVEGIAGAAGKIRLGQALDAETQMGRSCRRSSSSA